MAETFVPPTSTSYPAVFTVVRESLDGALADVASSVLDGIARTVAAKMDERQLAPAAYGDKRRPHYTHAAIGCDGVSVNLCFRDGSAEFVFVEEELEITREDGRDIYTAHVAASEVLALRQALIDYLPAAEGIEDRAVPSFTPTPEAIEAASAAYYDGMTGTAEERWPHHEGWAGKSEAFKGKVRAHMARALTAALAAPAAKGGTEVRDENGFSCEYDGSLPDDDFTVTWDNGARWVMLHRSGKITVGQSPGNHRLCKTTSWEELFSPTPPAGAAGGSAVWTDPASPEAVAEIKAGMQSIQDFTIPGYVSFDGTYHGPSPVLAGAAGGGPGDLAALSAGAGAIAQAMLDEHHNRVTPIGVDDASFGMGARAGWDAAVAEFMRRLTEAPTPDLGAQGDAVASGGEADAP